jgi:hypothetical protein
MAKITNGRVVAEVADDKVAHYCLMTGFRLVEENAHVEVEESPKPKRGRPKKVSNSGN